MGDYKKIYELFINKPTIKTKELNNIGFNSKNINKLIEDNIIERLTIGNYALKDINGFFSYCLSLDNELLEKGLLTIVHYNPCHVGANAKLFEICILNERFDESIKYLVNFYKEYPNEQPTIKLFIYLLSFFVELPSELRNHIKDLTSEDIIPIVKKYSYDYSNHCIEKMRDKLFKGYYKSALNNMREVKEKEGYLNTEEEIIYNLVSKIREHSRCIKTNLLLLFKANAYEEARDLLIEESNKHVLTKFDDATLYMFNVLISIKKTGKIPECSDSNDDFIDAIKHNDYSKAIKIYKNYNYFEYDVFYVLLNYLSDIVMQKETINSTMKEYSDEENQEWFNEKIKLYNELGFVLLDDITPKRAYMFAKYNLDNKKIQLINLANVSFIMERRTYSHYQIMEMYNDGEYAYKLGRYQECIDKLINIVGYVSLPAMIYKFLGDSYMKVNNQKLALMFYKIFVLISKRDEIEIKRIIAKLEESKTYEVVSSSDDRPNKTVEKRVGLNNTQIRIVIYLMETGMDILEASKHANLSFEEIQLLYLIFAKEYYKLNDERMGDFYLKSIIKCENKSNEVIKQMKRLIADKKVLLNKREELENSIVINLKRIKPNQLQ